MQIRVTGLNHTRASVDLREKLAVDGAALAAALAELRQTMGAAEAVILSTCNRVELYTVHEGSAPPAGEVAAILARRHGVEPGTLEPVLYHHHGADAVRHLFRVASSLDSMVLGETQIIGQVKDAYLAAKETGTTGRVFNRLFQKALAVAKRVHTSTSLGEKNVSVPSVAARLAEKIFQDLSTKELVIVGAGETGELTVSAFKTRGIARIHVVNRTVEHARALADRCGGQAYPMDALPLVLPRGDIVIGCIRSDEPVIGPDQLRPALQARRQEPMFLIDIAVPRNIHADANRLENVYLYNIDDLETIVKQNVMDREREVSRCTPLIEEETETFLKEVTPPDIATLLTTLRQRVSEIGDDEMKRTLARLNGLSEEQKGEVAEMVRRIVNKVLHSPSETLRSGGPEGLSHATIELIRKLFGINK